MLIRRFTGADKPQIIELLALNTPQYFSPNEENDLIDYLDHHIELYYVLEIDHAVLACGGINLTDNGETARLSWDIVHPESQGKGLGSAITAFRIERIKEMAGVKTICVRTSQLVYPFYEKFGLELKEIVKDYWDKGFDMYRLEVEIR